MRSLFRNGIMFLSMAMLIFTFVGCNKNDSSKQNESNKQSTERAEYTNTLKDLVINKSEIGGQVKYYPFEVDGQKMQVMAVKTEDGKVRTAFDTCQVCNGSPRAYYEQDGDVVVCQNCGNRFTMSMIEEQKGGCNPIPIMPENKSETYDEIVINKEYLEQNKGLFTANWRTK